MVSATGNSGRAQRTAGPWRRVALAAALLGMVGSLTVSCQMPKSRRAWLVLFFDGVPPEGQPASRVAAAEAPPPTRLPVPTQKEPGSASQVHKPYADQDCGACHDLDAGLLLKRKPPDLCFGCHTNFLAQAKSKHAPAEDGDCLQCHRPHESTENHLLVKTGKDLCYQCHDDVTKGLKFKHAPAEDGKCLKCHSPHAAAQKQLLVKAGRDLCYQCHADVTKGLKFKHAPAEEGDCLACHGGHGAAQEHLLLKTGQALCYQCHDRAEVTGLAAHKQIGQTDCAACHEPHGGGHTAFVREEQAQPGGKP